MPGLGGLSLNYAYVQIIWIVDIQCLWYNNYEWLSVSLFITSSVIMHFLKFIFINSDVMSLEPRLSKKGSQSLRTSFQELIEESPKYGLFSDFDLSPTLPWILRWISTDNTVNLNLVSFYIWSDLLILYRHALRHNNLYCIQYCNKCKRREKTFTYYTGENSRFILQW